MPTLRALGQKGLDAGGFQESFHPVPTIRALGQKGLDAVHNQHPS